jgi:phosphoribosyl-dephospho-CoA transferase
MPPLRRHQLAHLTAAGWRELLNRDWDDESRACLQHWAEHALPLVVTRQPAPAQEGDALVALGLPTPACWGRRPLALQAAPGHISWLNEFPPLAQAIAELSRTTRSPLQRLDIGLRQKGVVARVYGSAGWQRLSGLPYLHEHSDLDLWLAVDSADQADAAIRLLQQCDTSVRIDGELMFANGSAVAWREWAAWREGRCSQVLVKRLHGAGFEADPEALVSVWPCAA